MRLGLAVFVMVFVVNLLACDLGQFTVRTTAKVLVRAQPALQQESDYQLAHDAIPATLKTVEGFWIVDPDNSDLIGILTEGYCQYGTAFVEDDWEVASLQVPKNPVEMQAQNARATHIFTRCLNYALRQLGERWQAVVRPDDDRDAGLAYLQRTRLSFSNHRDRCYHDRSDRNNCSVSTMTRPSMAPRFGKER